MAMRTAEDVMQMETDIAYLRDENAQLKQQIAFLQSERTRLQLENTMLSANSMESMRKATRVETILDHIAASLVVSLRDLREERQIERDMRSRTQEPTPQPRQPPAVERLSEAAEQIAPPKPPLARIDHTLAARDSRLPTVDFPSDEHRSALDDQAQLRALGEGMVK